MSVLREVAQLDLPSLSARVQGRRREVERFVDT